MLLTLIFLNLFQVRRHRLALARAEARLARATASEPVPSIAESVDSIPARHPVDDANMFMRPGNDSHLERLVREMDTLTLRNTASEQGTERAASIDGAPEVDASSPRPDRQAALSRYYSLESIDSNYYLDSIFPEEDSVYSATSGASSEGSSGAAAMPGPAEVLELPAEPAYEDLAAALPPGGESLDAPDAQALAVVLADDAVGPVNDQLVARAGSPPIEPLRTHADVRFWRAIHDIYTCPVCDEIIYPHFLQCDNGHALCSNCAARVTRCPLCRGDRPYWRNCLLESNIRTIPFPCPYITEGCRLYPYAPEWHAHVASCPYRPGLSKRKNK